MMVFDNNTVSIAGTRAMYFGYTGGGWVGATVGVATDERLGLSISLGLTKG